MSRSKPAAPPPARTAVDTTAAPSVLASVPPTLGLPPKGRLEWPQLLGWLHEDGWIGAEDAERVAARFRAGASSLHALVRLCAAGLTHQRSGKALDT